MSWSPTLLPDLQVWFDATKFSGLVDGTAVATWADSSGNARNATQGVAASKPLYKVGIQNGLPALLFDGVNDMLATAAFNWPTVQATIVAVGYSDLASSRQFVTWGDDPILQVGAFGLLRESGLRLSTSLRGTVGQSAFTTSTTINGGWHVMAGLCDMGLASGETAVVLDGSFGTIGGSNNNNLDTSFGAFGFGLGAGTSFSRPLSGYLGEVVVYSRVLTTSERQIVEGYLAWKWGLSSLLPSTHPFKTYAPHVGGGDDFEGAMKSSRSELLRREREARQRDDEESIEAVLRAFAHVVCR